MTVYPHLTLRQFQAIVRSGVRSIMLHRLRSVLTTLGMVFGVCSVIAMLAIGEGANYEAQRQIQELGSQNIILRSKKPPEQANRSQTQDNVVLSFGLTYDDVMSIRQTIPGVSVIVPDRKRRDFAFHRRERLEVELVGTVPWYPELRNRTLQRGRFLTDRDLARNNKICVLEETAVTGLFPMTHPLGATVRLGRHYFEVVGILNAKAESDRSEATGPEDSTLAPRIFLPLSTARALFGEITVRQRGQSFDAEEVQLHEVTVRVEELEQVEGIARVISAQLTRDHPKNDFELIVPLELLRQAERTKRIFSTVLGSIAAISLLVGGIGIMNIMLASVSERTREIGIRRALGAKRFDIIAQFLVETTLLACTGGVIGVLVGVAIPAGVGMLTDMVTIVTWWSPLMALIISASTGVAFGLYPAYQAARMDPVEALRHE